MKAKTTWIIIADRSRAFVMVHEGPGSGLKAVKEAQWKADVSSGASDQPGRSFASFGSARSALVPHVNSQAEEEMFATKIAAKLAAAHKGGNFDQLVLCAGPKMLSALVNSVEPMLGGTVRATVQKNLVNTPPAEMASHFDEVLLL
ncbi:host attachment protein [Pararhizobium sp. IMCC21322]|uniref:host attachment protein n=1 Tax=Pararhizobium sp. IMCC21322 TaxID=3067903 RepID=UPI002740E6AB|nr:host attachment protein [Pararhizobium sp. IMCC21322]